MEILSKITMRTIMGGEVKPFLGDKESVELAQIYGFATGTVKGDRPTQFGDNIWLAGEFKAKNLLNGKMFYAPKLYPPEIMFNIISAQLVGTEGTGKVLFAMVIGIKKSKAVLGYEYSVSSLIEPKEENNPFALIENQIHPQPAVNNNTNPGAINDPSSIEFEA